MLQVDSAIGNRTKLNRASQEGWDWFGAWCLLELEQNLIKELNKELNQQDEQGCLPGLITEDGTEPKINLN